MPVIDAAAHAKINLALSVGAPISDGAHAGLHPVCSWMHAIDLHDSVRVERLGEGEGSRYAVAWDGGRPVEWLPDADLAVRAHRALEVRAGRPLPASVRVTKRIPAGGGLGGGSADAAVVLLALNDLFDLRLGEPELHEVGLTLGSDVAYFIDTASWAGGRPPRPAVVSGVGAAVRRLERRRGELTLVLPPFGCATGAVYRAFDAGPGPGLDGARVLALAAAPPGAGLFNDLAAPACAVEPGLGALLRGLEAAGLEPHVSGSGSTVFMLGRCVERAGAVAAGCRVIGASLA